MTETLTNEKVAERARECIGDHISSVNEDCGETIITLKTESVNKLLEICTVLRDDEILALDYLSFVTGFDYLHYPSPPPHKCRFEIIYQLFSVEAGHHLRMKVPVPDRDGKLYLDSVVPIWRGAEFMEMEIYDMFGIDFPGHPDMRRLYLPDDWDGHPLRKDYDIRKGQNYGVLKVKELVARHEKRKVK